MEVPRIINMCLMLDGLEDASFLWGFDGLESFKGVEAFIVCILKIKSLGFSV